jgi:DNA-binding transcriptional MerR regulator
MGIKAYIRVRRDPATGYRLYTGRDIRRILEYEMKRADEKAG